MRVQDEQRQNGELVELAAALGQGLGREVDVVVRQLNFRARENMRGWGGWASKCCAAAG